MLPIELKRDKDGLLYISDDRILMHSPLLIDHRDLSENRYYISAFYRLISTDDYIVKYSLTWYTKKEIKNIKEMLLNLAEKQDKVKNVDFPIGYFSSGRRLAGQIIKYYPNGISWENVIKENDIKLLEKYYFHDDDAIHNLFLLIDEVLNHMYEMFENEIYYMDPNPGNIILDENKAKLIDFDPHYVKFGEKDEKLARVVYSYYLLLNEVLPKYHLIDNLGEAPTNFEQAKTLTKKLENEVRKNR